MIIVTMTTLPSRVQHLSTFMQSIAAQTLKPANLVVWVPDKSIREDCGYEIPHWLDKNVVRCGRDWGPATKLIPIIGRAAYNDIVVTVDDDVAYGPHTIEELADGVAANPGCAVGLCGVSRGKYVHAEQISQKVCVDVLGGYRAIAYPVSILNQSMVEDAKALLDYGMFTLDDHLFAWNLNRRHIPRVVIPTKYPGDNGSLNCRLYKLSNGVYDEGANRALVDSSMANIRRLYDAHCWPKPE